MKISRLLFCMAVFCAAVNGHASTYYVSASGNDNFTGKSFDQAWKTIAKVNGLNIQPGDTILFEGGQSFSGNLYMDASDANNAAKVVVFSSYGTGKARINAGNGTGFYAYNTQGFSISNILFEGAGTNTNTGDGILIYSDLSGNAKLGTITIRDTEIQKFGKTGITIGSWNGNTGFKDVLLDNVHVHDIRENGIVTYGYDTQTSAGSPHFNVTIKNSRIHDVTGYADPNGHKGSGIILAQVDKGLIENCVAYNNGTKNVHCGGPGGIWAYSCNNITIQFCESYNNSSGAAGGCDGLGFDFDGGITNSILQFNYSHDNDGAGYLLGQYDYARPWSNNVIRYNISENDGRTNAGGIMLFKGPGCTMNGVEIYHNTIYTTPSPANTAGACAFKILDWHTGINGVEAYNNIFQTTGGAALIDIPNGYSAYFAGNLYWSSGSGFIINYQGKNYNDLAGWRAATGNEKTGGTSAGLEADPLLINAGGGGTIYPDPPYQMNAYWLPANSPAVNSGLDLGALFGINPANHDFFNNTAPAGTAPDIGAFENSTIATSVSNDADKTENALCRNPIVTGDNIVLTCDEVLHSVELFTLYGALILKTENINSNSITISARNMARGAYLLRVIDKKGNFTVSKLMIE